MERNDLLDTVDDPLIMFDQQDICTCQQHDEK
jgi:hypothetical protein